MINRDLPPPSDEAYLVRSIFLVGCLGLLALVCALFASSVAWGQDLPAGLDAEEATRAAGAYFSLALAVPGLALGAGVAWWARGKQAEAEQAKADAERLTKALEAADGEAHDTHERVLALEGSVRRLEGMVEILVVAAGERVPPRRTPDETPTQPGARTADVQGF